VCLLVGIPFGFVRLADTWGSFDCVASSLRCAATALKMTVVGGSGGVLSSHVSKGARRGAPFVRSSPGRCGTSSFGCGCVCVLRGLNRNHCLGGMAEAMPFSVRGRGCLLHSSWSERTATRFAQEVPGFQVLGPWVLAAKSWGSQEKASASRDHADWQDVPGVCGHQVGHHEI